MLASVGLDGCHIKFAAETTTPIDVYPGNLGKQ
jgi:hypothetical protein